MRVRPATTYDAVVGCVLARRRQATGMSQTLLAEAVGMTQPTWSKIEAGVSALSLSSLRAVAGTLGTSPGTLLSDADVVVAGITKLGIVVLSDQDSTLAYAMMTKTSLREIVDDL